MSTNLHERYHQATGHLEMIEANGNATLLGSGWAGNDSRPGVNPHQVQGRNNPAMQAEHNIGPLPRWTYTIGTPITHPHLGPLAFPLTPDPDPNGEMCGRSAFFIHGANSTDPLNSSEGCIIMPHDVRVHLAEFVAAGINRLEVVGA